MNEILNIIRKRRSTRRFKPEQISEQELEAILLAGSYAPSGGNCQTTHSIVIQNQLVLEELRVLVEQEFSKMSIDEHTYKSTKASILASQKGNYRFHYDAPILIITANLIGYGNAMADCACVLENMMLAATSLNVGSCWINQLHWLDTNQVIRNKLIELGLKGNETVCGGLALGYPAVSIEEMKPLERSGNLVTYIR